MRDRLTIDNCLHFLEMAEMYELSSCKTDTKRFILENFVSVAQNDAFLVSYSVLFLFLVSRNNAVKKGKLQESVLNFLFCRVITWTYAFFCVFQDISFELLCEFLEDDILRADSELEVFNVAVKWLENCSQPENKAKEVREPAVLFSFWVLE